jgi:hypothetical protein
MNENQPSEAQKFFDSLPSDKEKPDHQFFEKPTAEKREAEVSSSKEEPAPEPEKDEDAEVKRMNRQQRREASMRYYEQQLAEERAARERMEDQLKALSQKDKDDQDDRLKELFGDTPEGKKASKIIQELLSEKEQSAVEKAREYYQQSQDEVSKEEEAHLGEIYSSLEAIEDEHGVDLTSKEASGIRADFLDFVENLSPKDARGELMAYADFDNAWELFAQTRKATKSPETQARQKQLASRGVQRSATQRPDPTKLEPMTFEKAGNMFDKMFGR